MSAYRRDIDETKYIFFIKKKLLEKYGEIWHNVSNIKKVFQSKTVYNEKYLWSKIKSYKGNP